MIDLFFLKINDRFKSQDGCVHKVHDRVASNATIMIGVGIGKFILKLANILINNLI